MLKQLLDVQRLRSGGNLNLVVNRVRDNVLGSNPEKQLSQTFQSLVKIAPSHFLPDDPINTDGALRNGIPVRLFKRHSPYAKAVKALAQLLRV
jgi:MinD-like ATPase involved in chromosome partitioning or flagellar assembly